MRKESLFEHLQAEDVRCWLERFFLPRLETRPVGSGFWMERVALIAPNTQALRAIKCYLAERSISTVGLEYLTMEALFKRLVAYFDWTHTLPNKALEHWCLRRAATTLSANPYSKLALAAPQKILATFDTLESAQMGPDRAGMSVLVPLYRHYQQELLSLELLPRAALAAQMLEKAPTKSPLWTELHFVGIGAQCGDLLRAQRAAMALAHRGSFTHIGIPRHACEEVWLSTWEELLGREAQPLGGSNAPFSAVPSWLEEEGPEPETLPETLLGLAVDDEAILIVERIRQWALSLEDDFCAAIVIDPSHTNLRAAVAEKFEKANIPYWNDLGAPMCPSPAEETFARWKRWQSSGSIQDLLQWLYGAHGLGLIEAGDFLKLQRVLTQAAQECFSSDAAIALRYAKSELQPFAKILEWGQRLSENAAFEQYYTVLNKLPKSIFCAHSLLEATAPRLRSPSQIINRAALLELIDLCTPELPRYRSPYGRHLLAKMTLTTPQAARLGAWTHVICAGLNTWALHTSTEDSELLGQGFLEKLWKESLLQGSQGEGHLIAGRGWILPPSFSLFASMSAWLEVMRLPTRGLALSASFTELPPVNPHGGLTAWFEKASWAKLKSAQIPISFEKTRPENKDALIENAPPHPIDALSCTGWERALTSPIEGWLEHVIKVHPIEGPFDRGFAARRGIWVHDWLVVAPQSQWQPIPDFAHWQAHIQAAASSLYARVHRACAGQPLNPLFAMHWNWAIAQAEEFARRVIALSAEFSWMIQEHTLEKGIRVEIPGSPLTIGISGRLDLALATHKGSGKVAIIDFKTGNHARPWTLRALEEDSAGAQLALYGLALSAGGFTPVGLARMSCDRPGKNELDLSWSQLGPQCALWEKLARLSATGIHLDDPRHWEFSAFGEPPRWPKAFYS